jgi:hypothetical protein
VMRYSAPGFGRRLGGTDIEAAVELEGIAIDYFSGESFCRAQGQIAFARCGGPDDNHQRTLDIRLHVLPS